MQNQWPIWLINICLIATLGLAVVVISTQGLFYWWLHIGHASIGVMAIWLKLFLEKNFGKQQHLPYYLGTMVVALLLLHLSTWLFVEGQSIEMYSLISILSQDLLVIVSMIALYYQMQEV